jgi:hypothetical protein
MDQHPNSRKITIRRLDDFLTRQQGATVQGWLSESKEGIGAYFQTLNSPVIGTGLEVREQELLLPGMLDFDNPKDRGFREALRKFYNSINTKVPYNGGITLEIGLTEDNSKPLSETNMPINLSEYIRYRHALKHPWVAANLTEGKGNQVKRFYIWDPESVKRQRVSDAEVKDKALKYYLALDKEEKLDMMLIMFNEDIRKFEDIGDKRAKLKELTDKKPVEFVNNHEKDHFEERYWIRLFVLNGVFKKVGESFYDVSNMEFIGGDEEEAIMSYKDPNKVEMVRIWKAKVQEAMKKKAKAKGK